MYKRQGLAAFIPSLASLSPAFTAINFATLSIMALPIVFLIGVEMARKNKVPEYICAIACLAGYICVVPQTVSVVVEGATAAAAGLPGAAIGAQGLLDVYKRQTFVSLKISVIHLVFLMIIR